MNSLTYTLGLDVSGFVSNIRQASGSFESLTSAGTRLAGMRMGAFQDAAVSGRTMRESLDAARNSATGLQRAFHTTTAAISGFASAARLTSGAIALFPRAFSGLPPAVTKSLSAMSLAGRAAEIYRGKLGAVGAAATFLELRQLGVTKSTAAFSATSALAASTVIRAWRAAAQAPQQAANAMAAAGRVAQAAARGIATVGTASGAALSKITSLIGPLAGVTAGLGLMATTGMLLKSSIGKAADFESLNAEFTVMLGNAKAAQKMVGEIRDFGKSSPFEAFGLAKSARTLLAFGVANKTILPTLKMLGDVAGSSQEKLDQLTLAFAQISSAGKLQGQDLLQLINAGFNPLQEISRKTGRSLASLREQMEGGSISAKMVEDAFRSATASGGRFFQNSITQGRTFNGLVSTLMDAWNELRVSFGTPIMQALKPVIGDSTKLIEQWGPHAEKFGQAIGKGLIVIRELFQSGQIWTAAQAGLKLAGATLVNTVNAGLQGIIAGMISGMAESAGIFQRLMGESGLWEGIGHKLQSVFLGLKSTLLDTFASVVASLPKVLGGGEDRAALLRNGSLVASGEAMLANNETKKAFASIDLQGLVEQIAAGVRNNGAAAIAGYQNAGELIPTGALIGQMENLINPMLLKAEAFFAKENGQQAAESSKQTATNTRALIKVGEEAIMSLKMISDKVGSWKEAGSFA